ncbi:MAG TPA: FAD-dependent oxidoreductase [Acidisphaera sp.]|nr:FAD-dependent oxidoreductase [Acidisphaera sp.]
MSGNGGTPTAADWVIVGGGPAGCAIAARLARARPEASVVLIEAGRAKANALSNIPIGFAFMRPSRTAYNYAFSTVPQPGLNGRTGYQPRGRGLGGSTLINAMIYIRGQREDYDGWAAAGCDGWSWKDVLPLFKRSENNERGADDLHGTGGPLNVADLRDSNPISRTFLDAAAQAGFRLNPDFNGLQQEGIGFYQVTQKNGRRFNAARAYLGENRPSNLSVITDAEARRILFDGRRATGVEYLAGGRVASISARRSVVISAGSFGSPHLLMVSGIGPAEHLKQHGITVVHDSPEVGANLQDHPDFVLHVQVNNRNLIGLSAIPQLIGEWKQFRNEGRGMLTTNIGEAGGFLCTQPGRPDVQLHFCIAMVDDHGRRRHFPRGMSLHVCVLRPKSRGTVRLAGPDIATRPVIDPAFFSDPEDMETMVRGVMLGHRIMSAPALASLGGKPLRDRDFKDEAELRKLIPQYADTIYHPVGTCRMGSDPTSVLDPQLRVRGVDRLMVADASIMPALISGNTQAPSAMIGEKASDLLLQAAN